MHKWKINIERDFETENLICGTPFHKTCDNASLISEKPLGFTLMMREAQKNCSKDYAVIICVFIFRI